MVVSIILLLIDDEADNASINTKSKQNAITRINEGIRDILSQFRKATYVGYTATPFANIFINPNSRDAMLGEDLFPRDFIQILEPPNNYVGPEQVFSKDSPLSEKMVKIPEDYEDLIPLKHKNHHY